MDMKEECRIIVAKAVNQFIENKAIQAEKVSPEKLLAENPPKKELGDVAFPLFTFAKTLRMAPPVIAKELESIIAGYAKEGEKLPGDFFATGPYLNVHLNKGNANASILKKIFEQGDNYGMFNNDGKSPMQGRRVMVEFSSPNTNKPLHLGHLRNDALGESVSRMLKKCGAEVFKVNIINNRGVHICKSMYAYKIFHEKNGDTPEKLGIKSDRFVGDCYVEFNNIGRKADGSIDKDAQTKAEEAAQNMLIEWEKGNAEVHKLWKQMNDWAINGVKETYKRTGVSFDKLYYESETYLKGKDEILKGLEKGIFFKAEDGSVRINVSSVVGKNKDGEEQEKVLLRKDGTSVYITQDIGTAISRHNDWDFNSLVYVVGSEQIYHFKVLFYILNQLGFDWAKKLYHLSYGMVNLPEGRMKSREGTVVDADDLIDSLRDGALEQITEKGRTEAVGNPDEVAEKIALGALHYFLLQVSPTKDMIFNPKESLSFNGNTGPYLQYMGARISSILKKANESGIESDYSDETMALLTEDQEWSLIKALGEYPQILEKAADKLDPSTVAVYLYDVSKLFSKFYHDCPILSIAKENPKLAQGRLALAECTRTVLKNAFEMILVPFLETM